MALWRKVVLGGVIAATASVVNTGVAAAYQTIDYGTNKQGCMAAERQARASGFSYANCYETGPGHYSLALDN